MPGTGWVAAVDHYRANSDSLHHIRLRTLSFNTRGTRAYTRAGFRLVGRWREAHRFGGRAYDVILMDCLASEFSSPVLHTLVPPDE
jgi:diamine N-acetyltransferase